MTAAADVNLDDLKRRARRRLVGAIVLALLVAVAVPMLLESDPKPLGEDVAVKIPPVGEGKFVNRLSDRGKQDAPKGDGAKSGGKTDTRTEPPKPAAKPEAGTGSPSTENARPDRVPDARSEPGKAEPSQAETPAASPSAAVPAPTVATPTTSPPAASTPAASAPAADVPAAASTKTGANGSAAIPAATANGLFAVQVYAFSDVYGANSLVNKLKRVGYPAYSEPTTTSKGQLWRVRIGPYPSREVAATARDKLKGEGYNGIVTTR
ncbi:MAG: SPOR domain-containing protein [Burkholderiales bacterium]|nr:SPOR domain-containing protein [Burkholderiales bacterium]